MRTRIVRDFFGPEVRVLWFDGQWDASYCEIPEYGERLEAFLRKVKPSIIINNRIGAGASGNIDYGPKPDGTFRQEEQVVARDIRASVIGKRVILQPRSAECPQTAPLPPIRRGYAAPPR